MAKLSIKKIEIVALLHDRKKIIERLQRRQIVEFSDFNDENLVKLNTSATVSQFEKNIIVAIEAKEIMDEYVHVKKSITSSLNGRREIAKDDFGKYVEFRDIYLKECHDIINCKKNIIDHKASIVRTQTLKDALSIWINLDVPMQYNGTKNTKCFIGVIPGKKTEEEILCSIAAQNPSLEMLYVQVISAYKEQTCIALICHKDIAEETNEALRHMGFILPSDPSKVIPKEKMISYDEDIVKYNNEIQKNTDIITSYADKISDLEFFIDYLTIRKDKYLALNKIGLTKNTFIITGYIPEKYAEACVSELEKRFNVAISLSDPEEKDDVPVLLENNDFSAPVESITAMYAMPGKNDIDPSSVMAFFYYMFFGIMLSDAGYGLIMVIGTYYALKKFNIEGSLKKTLKMFFYSGISTVFWGAMFGSWFGDIVPIICEQFLNVKPPNLALWFEPIKDPIKFLLAAFLFGIVHLFVGLGVNFYMIWKSGKKIEALLTAVPIYVFVIGAAPLCAAVLVPIPAIITKIGGVMALTGATLIVLTSGRSAKNVFAKFGLGLYGLYGVASGYLSDILSYSRLLALGLATGSIAGVVNMMGAMPSNLFLKGLLLTIVFLIGHPLNMAINLLGAYVHTNRLQFVEFFSKFYEGGGRSFNPLKVNTKFIKFKEND